MKWLTLLFVLFIGGVIVIADFGLGQTWFAFINAVPGGDKTGHLVLMGVLSFLVNYSLNAAKIRLFLRYYLMGSFVILIFVTVEEFTQIFLLYRGFSLVDLIFDYIGVFLGGRIADSLFLHRKIEQLTPEN